MTPQEYAAATRLTRNHNLTLTQQWSNAALGLGEVGELQNIIKKHLYHGHDLQFYELLDEAGDILYYLQWIFDLMDADMSRAMQYNITKLKNRYPEGFSEERSRNRITGASVANDFLAGKYDNALDNEPGEPNEPKCDLCGKPDHYHDALLNDWNGDTGNHFSYEKMDGG